LIFGKQRLNKHTAMTGFHIVHRVKCITDQIQQYLCDLDMINIHNRYIIRKSGLDCNILFTGLGLHDLNDFPNNIIIDIHCGQMRFMIRY